MTRAILLAVLLAGCAERHAVPICFDMSEADTSAAAAGIEDWGLRVEIRKPGDSCIATVLYGTAPPERPNALGYTAARPHADIVYVRGDPRAVARHEWGHVMGFHD